MKRTFIYLMVLFVISHDVYSETNWDYINSIIMNIDTDEVDRTLKELTGDEEVFLNDTSYYINTRWYQDTLNEIACQYLTDRAIEMGYSTNYQDIVYKFELCRSILISKPGMSKPDEILILGAHYDSGCPECPGADDNASGCAAVMEAMRVLKDLQFEKTIVFAFWDQEEVGLYGSATWVDSVKKMGLTKIESINADMIGYTGAAGYRYLVYADTNKGNKTIELLDHALTAGDNIDVGWVLHVPATQGSDNMVFEMADYPVISFTEDRTVMNPYYHTINDKYEIIMSEYLYNQVRLIIATACSAAGVKLEYSVDEQAANIENFFPYPNPTDGEFSINTNGRHLRIEIFDLLGHLVASRSYSNNLNTVSFNLNEFTLSAGSYFCKIIDMETGESFIRNIMYK